jgi:hypothetical protein
VAAPSHEALAKTASPLLSVAVWLQASPLAKSNLFSILEEMTERDANGHFELMVLLAFGKKISGQAL